MKIFSLENSHLNLTNKTQIRFFKKTKKQENVNAGDSLLHDVLYVKLCFEHLLHLNDNLEGNVLRFYLSQSTSSLCVRLYSAVLTSPVGV